MDKMIVFLVAGFLAFAHANEGGGESEGGGEKTTEKKSGDSREYVEYQKKSSKLNTLRSRIDEDNHNFEELVKRKISTRDTQAQQQYAEQMAAIAKERNQWVKE